MDQNERKALRRRFQFRCCFCGVSEHDVGAKLTVDHYRPSSRGGLDVPTNWVYCCHACNEFKGDYWQPESINRILHPLLDDVPTHLAEGDDGVLRPLTQTGSFHIARLNLNRSQLVAHRLEKRGREVMLHERRRLIERLKDLEEQVETLTSQMEWLERGDSNPGP